VLRDKMRGTWNPIRRNKNIGTKATGHGKDNKMVIPNRIRNSSAFWENLNSYVTTTRIVNENEIRFIVELTNNNYKYHCTIDDIAYLLSFVPEDDIGILDLIVFRQPKNKEVIQLEYRVLGSTGIKVSRLCFGCLTVGPLQANLPVEEGARVIARAFEMGVNFIDTAKLYNTYHYIKRAIEISGKKDIVISSKSYDYTY
jgi:hypothetical protein